MTRNEQIDIASIDWWLNKVNQNGDAEMAFKAGAMWADAHPRWISVEDELPKDGDSVIVMQDVHGNTHFTACEFLSAKQLADVTDFHVRSDAYLGVSKNAEVTLGAVTHWMPLPQPSKKRGEHTKEEIKGNQGKIFPNRIIGTEEHIRTALDVIEKGGEQ